MHNCSPTLGIGSKRFSEEHSFYENSEVPRGLERDETVLSIHKECRAAKFLETSQMSRRIWKERDVNGME